MTRRLQFFVGWLAKSTSVAWLILASCTSAAYSGAGGECGNKAFERAAMYGTPAELLFEIDKKIEDARSAADKLNTTNFFGLKLKSRQPLITDQKELRKIVVNSWRGCEGLLLDYAVVAGNLKIIDLLIDLGADPNGRETSDPSLQVALGVDPNWLGFTPVHGSETVFMRCRYINKGGDGISVFSNVDRTEEQRRSALSGYRHLLKFGVDLNMQHDHHKTNALEMCKDIDIVKLMLENGANPNEITCYGVTHCNSVFNTSLDFHAERILAAYSEHAALGDDIKNKTELLDAIISRHATRQVTKARNGKYV